MQKLYDIWHITSSEQIEVKDQTYPLINKLTAATLINKLNYIDELNSQC